MIKTYLMRFFNLSGVMNCDLSSEEYTSWLAEEMGQVCDLAARRIGSSSPKRAAYWWCDEIGDLRRRCIAMRRRFRARRDPDSAAYTFIKNDYLVAKRA